MAVRAQNPRFGGQFVALMIQSGLGIDPPDEASLVIDRLRGKAESNK